MAGLVSGQVDRVSADLEILGLLGRSGVNRSLVELRDAVASFEIESVALEKVTSSRLDAGTMSLERARRVNQTLRRVGLALTSPGGVPGDPWSRQLAFASDPANGYSTLPLPGIRLAMRAGDPEEVRLRLVELAEKLRAATDLLAAAREIADG